MDRESESLQSDGTANGLLLPVVPRCLDQNITTRNNPSNPNATSVEGRKHRLPGCKISEHFLQRQLFQQISSIRSKTKLLFFFPLFFGYSPLRGAFGYCNGIVCDRLLLFLLQYTHYREHGSQRWRRTEDDTTLYKKRDTHRANQLFCTDGKPARCGAFPSPATGKMFPRHWPSALPLFHPAKHTNSTGKSTFYARSTPFADTTHKIIVVNSSFLFSN